MTEYYSPNQIADKLGLTPATIRTYIRENKLPHSRPGGKIIRITDDDLNVFLSRYRHGL